MKKDVCSRDFMRDYNISLLCQYMFCCLLYRCVCLGTFRCPSDLVYIIQPYFENYVKINKK